MPKITTLTALFAAVFLLTACSEPAVTNNDPKVTAEPVVSQQQSEPLLTVYKTSSCGCCKKWISHIEQNGITAIAKDYDDLSFIKNRYGIQPNHISCHTAVSENGYVFEGHIPAKYIRQFLAESHPDAIGLSVPAMPLGSPGMEVEGRFMPYDILLLHKDGSASVYAHISDAAMQ
ncbi:DUF411 domain-containing protein [Rheinheimera sp.]|uniref:DUF411 domain-containing protein n=1 Tax=Rheinheimera sp. TaxID=1869214 RepID=UPI0040481976